MNKIVAIKRRHLPREAMLLYGRIAEQDGDACCIALDNGEILNGRRAAGCLLVPEAGDEVLIAVDGNRAFVLNVLFRNGEAARINLPECTTIAGDELAFAARRVVSMEAPRISLAGIQGEVKFAGISILSQWCDARISRITAVAEIWDRVVGRLTERIRDSYRRIDNAEQTMAGRIRTMVKGRFSVTARNAAVVAEAEAKLDGNKIHIG